MADPKQSTIDLQKTADEALAEQRKTFVEMLDRIAEGLRRQPFESENDFATRRKVLHDTYTSFISRHR